MVSFWNTFFYEPLYNALIFLIGVVPGENVGLAVIALTVVVKAALYPLSQKSVHTQAKMRSLEGELSLIKEKHQDDKKKQAEATMELYRKHNVNPFSGCLTVLIQLPIIIALYFVFLKGLAPNGGVLYSFVQFPEQVNSVFLGVDIASKSITFALVAALAQFWQTHLTLPKQKPRGETASFADEFSRSMNVQMRYVLPVFVALIAYTTSAAVALYWIVSSLFSVGQELLVRRRARVQETNNEGR
ncbi:MAG: YidC/Oxa1 family membrane protein insertase [bacterium]|nr:YidC/Oxa1 family membrane protein insertase [bacterium]